MKNGNQGDGGGREDIIFNEDQLIELEALAACLTVDQIADYFSISRSTFYNMMQRQPEVDGHYKRGRAKVVNLLAQGIITDATSGCKDSRKFYLRTQAGWAEKQEIDLTSRGSLDVNVTKITKDMTPEAAAEIYKEEILSKQE